MRGSQRQNHASSSVLGPSSGASSPSSIGAPPARVTLPSDLSGSLKYLDDAQLNRLLEAVTVEINRRNQGGPKSETASALTSPLRPRAQGTGDTAPPHVVVAAGHAASYALYHAAFRPGTIKRLVLIAPTWRGPLPTMMGGQRPWFTRLRGAVDHWAIGPLVYRLNVSRFIMIRMAQDHVYEDPSWLSGDRLAAKLAVTRAPGLRALIAVAGSLRRLPIRPKQPGASKGATTNFTAPAY